MKKIYTKKCPCGNTIELFAERTDDKTTNYKVTGSINLDMHYRAICTCWKVYSLSRWTTKFENATRAQ